MRQLLNLLAFDFGASSGRGMLGQFDGKKIILEELHRFSNDPVELCGHFYWDTVRLFWEIKQGLLKYANSQKGTLSGIGIDTWGVDFGLLGASGELLGMPYHYRDSRTENMFDEAFARMPKEEIFKRTGIAFQKFNTLYQLLAMKIRGDAALEKAETLLFMPDLFAYFLTGVKGTEFTEATTSQLLDPKTRNWSFELIRAMDLPEKIFTPIQQPGVLRGKILPTISEELGIGQIPVIAVATHDTGSAVAAVPAIEGDYAYISSGTWSLMGVEVDNPIINEKTLGWNYTNEGSVEGKYRMLKNIMGLWIVQECKREWDRRSDSYSFGELMQMAEASPAFICSIDPDHDSFYSPGNMPEKVQNFCASTGQKVPQTKGEIIRCVYESLAMKYRLTMEGLEEILGKPLPVLHIVGGGTQNRLLNQFTSNAIHRPVICGPIEATAIGNLMIQAMALGEVRNVREIREIVKNSFPTEDYMPCDQEQWDEAYRKFLKLL